MHKQCSIPNQNYNLNQKLSINYQKISFKKNQDSILQS